MLVFSVTLNLNTGAIIDVQLRTWSKICLMKCTHLMKAYQYMKPHHLINRVFQSRLLDFFYQKLSHYYFRKSPDQEAKYIVFESCLLALFMSCPLCNCKIEPNLRTVGTLVCVTQTCDECGYHTKWESQPMIKNVPAGNLLLSAAILFAGAHPAKTLRVLKFLGCAAIKPWTFYEHQRLYLHQAISNVWSRYQMAMITSLQTSNEPIAIGGDGRSDSPGHSAKYGAYSFMDLKHNVVLDIELVQVNMLLCASNICNMISHTYIYTIHTHIHMHTYNRAMRWALAIIWKRKG